MYTGIYKLAGLPIEICSIHQFAQDYCAGYETTEAPQFRVSITQEDIDREKKFSADSNIQEGLPVQDFSDSYLETLAIHRQIANEMIRHNTLLFHGSSIAVDGQTYLFTAKSGTGKSTHTRLWRQMLGDRAIMVNDDKPLLRISDHGTEVCGTPWNGKHRLSTNTILPLRAICVLERGEVNEIHPISVREVLPILLQQSYRPTSPAGIAQYMSMLDMLARNVKFYRLHCNMDPEAAEVSYRVLSQG